MFNLGFIYVLSHQKLMPKGEENIKLKNGGGKNDTYSLKTWFTQSKCGDLHNSKYVVGACFQAKTCQRSSVL